MPTAPTSFPGGNAENHAADWLRSICEVRISGSKKISEGMPPDPDRHRETDVIFCERKEWIGIEERSSA